MCPYRDGVEAASLHESETEAECPCKVRDRFGELEDAETREEREEITGFESASFAVRGKEGRRKPGWAGKAKGGTGSREVDWWRIGKTKFSCSAGKVGRWDGVVGRDGPRGQVSGEWFACHFGGCWRSKSESVESYIDPG